MNETGFEAALAAAIEELGVALGPEALRFCALHFSTLCEANARVNLTRIESTADAAQKHYADSLLPLRFDLLEHGARVLDIGSGAGFPGLPLWFFRNDLHVTLLDSQIKRVNFLKSCAAFAPDVAVVHARAEDAARTALRTTFDVVVSRALAPLSVLLELSLPFLRDNGVMIAYKGPKAAEELDASRNALAKLGGEARLLACDVPWGARTLVVTTKRGMIPDAYPRKAGIPQKSPLL